MEVPTADHPRLIVENGCLRAPTGFTFRECLELDQRYLERTNPEYRECKARLAWFREHASPQYFSLADAAPIILQVVQDENHLLEDRSFAPSIQGEYIDTG
jgi:hypothetical protein